MELGDGLEAGWIGGRLTVSFSIELGQHVLRNYKKCLDNTMNPFPHSKTIRGHASNSVVGQVQL